MPLRQTSAVVVRSLSYGESDRIVTFVTPDAGRLTGIAKGAKKSRRRFGAALELFTFVRLAYFEKPAFELVRLESAEIIAGFTDARRDLAKIAHAAYLVEVAGRAVQPREPAFVVFRLLVETLGAVDAGPADETRLRAFELRLLALLGYRPELRRCVRCRRVRPAEGRFRVSLRAGGLVCRPCSGEPDWDGESESDSGDYVTVSGGLLERMADFLELAEDHPDRLSGLVLAPAEALEARRLLPRVLAGHLGADFKSLGFMDRMAQEAL